MNKRFFKGLIIYALIFILLTGAGLFVFWNFIDAYEESRPINAAKAYLNTLTSEHMVSASDELLASVNQDVQSSEEASRVIHDALSGTYTYAKKSRESTTDKYVYAIRDGSQIIGQFAIEPGEEGRFGFRIWEVTEESFDFSYLQGSAIEITIPSDFSILVNDNMIEDKYITQKDIAYKALSEFANDYDMPTLVTYRIDGFLGDVNIEVIDRFGQTMQLADIEDQDRLLPECSDEEQEGLDMLAHKFIYAYVAYTGDASGLSAATNYYNMLEYMVRDTPLAKRLYSALDGLQYAQSNGDVVKSITMNLCTDIGNGRYFYDVTYVIETLGRAGWVETTNNLKLIILDTEDGLKVEAMTRY